MKKKFDLLIRFLVSIETPLDEVNNEYNFFVSNLILLQYTKEMSIFASS
jgi:hypothetical protein